MIPKFIYLFYFFGLICIYTCIYIIAALIHIERTIGLGTEFPLKSHYEFIIGKIFNCIFWLADN